MTAVVKGNRSTLVENPKSHLLCKKESINQAIGKYNSKSWLMRRTIAGLLKVGPSIFYAPQYNLRIPFPSFLVAVA